MKSHIRLLTIAATCACSLSFLADFACAQGQPQPGGGGAAGGRGQNRGGNNAQPGDRGGQRGGGGGMFGGFGGRGMEAAVSTDEMTRYGKMLSLTPAQNDAVNKLHEAYVAEATTAAEKMRDEMTALREEARDDPAAREDMATMFQKFRTKRQTMETGFFNDVKETLTPEQKNQWPVVERTRRRETTMNRGLMSGERADLVRIVDGLKLSADQQKPVTPILDQYQIDLDRELIARNEQQEKMQGGVRVLFTGGGDQTKMQKMIEEGRAAANKVREVNRRYARQIDSAITDETMRAKFDEQVRRESFPNIYRGNSQASRTVEAASAIDGLSAEQKTGIAEIKDRYTRDLGSINQKMEGAYEKRESTITAAEIVGNFGGGGGGGGRMGGGGMIDSEELTTLREQRRDLETSTVEKINAVLTEEQKAKMPQRDQGGRRGGGMNEGGGNGGGNGGNGGGRRNRPNNNAPQPAPNGRT